MIKNIIFDVGNVLVEVRSVDAMLEQGFSKERAERIYASTLGNPGWKEMDRGVLSREECIALLKKGLDEPLQKDLDLYFEKAVWHFVRPFPYTRLWLEELKNKGYKLYILSNYPSWLWTANSENAFNFLDLIDGKVVSGFEKVIKPDAAIYELLLSRYKLVPSESVFIDDLAVNIEGAKRQGINGIQFLSHEDAVSKLAGLL